MERTGAQIVWEVMTREGVDTIFGYPGGAILPTYDAMRDYPIRHVLVRHEQGASHMADGYARASGRVGVCIATSGPGATNLVTGIATAMLDSVPMVCVTGQVPSHMIGRDAFQETDVIGVTQPITKHNFLVTRADQVQDALRKAFYIARSGRPGPVLVDITKDAQQGTCEYEPSDEPIRLPGYRPDLRASDAAYAEAVELIANAERPVILAGNGIVQSGAGAELQAFVDKADVPVALTLLGLGCFPILDPRHLGMMGMHGEAWVNQAIQEADLLLAFGMRFDDRVTGNLATYAKNAKKVHVDIDPAEINKNVRVDVGLVGDLKAVLRDLTARLEPTQRAAWNGRIQGFKDAAKPRDIQAQPDDGKLYGAHVIRDLYRLTEGNALVVTDVGQHQMWEAQYYEHNRPRSLITSGGLGTMGFALPAAIGAKLACPEQEVWVIAGDGGFQMTACELSTIKQEQVKLHIAIINNGYLGMVRQWQEFFYGQRYAATPILSPDFCKLAEAHGLPSLRVTDRASVDAAVRAAQASEETMLVEFRVEQQDVVYPMVPAGADLDGMIRRPEPTPATSPAAEGA